VVELRRVLKTQIGIGKLKGMRERIGRIKLRFKGKAAAKEN
jgi:hypothetical protein